MHHHGGAQRGSAGCDEAAARRSGAVPAGKRARRHAGVLVSVVAMVLAAARPCSGGAPHPPGPLQSAPRLCLRGGADRLDPEFEKLIRDRQVWPVPDACVSENACLRGVFAGRGWAGPGARTRFVPWACAPHPVDPSARHR